MAEEDTTMERPFRITIQLSDFEARKLISWSKIHGKPKATYAGQIIGSQIELNAQLIDYLIESQAKSEGITSEELEKRWLEEEGYFAD
ncbi:MAG: hypothetical protein F6K16_31230 [Symploca sp. SIO2B6]|nr:hypothetical protein [Symploca sp. SIO2B6]